MGGLIKGKSIEEWVKAVPVIKKVIDLQPEFWLNEDIKRTEDVLPTLPLNRTDIDEADKRWKRFAPLIKELFPETRESGGIIESELVKVPSMKKLLEDEYKCAIEGTMLLKCDSHLPVAGSVKARGGIYEVLKHGEELAISKGLIKETDDYSIMAGENFRKFFSNYSLAVGSTGNLGISIGITGAALGFKVTVHMSSDAKEWKKQLLRSKGVNVIEYSSDYGKAVEEGRKQSQADPMSYFVDDEHSVDLFLGYSVAAYRLKNQLDDMGIKVDRDHPLFVYIPCGVGGAPGGIFFGLKSIFGDNVHCFFIEPTHSPCMLLGLATGLHDEVSVQDFGIDNRTDADGLAVGRPSNLVCTMMGDLISGVLTVEDHELYLFLAALKDSEGIVVEPSAAAAFAGPLRLFNSETGRSYIKSQGLEDDMENSTHIPWATGGLFLPGDSIKIFYERGKKLLESDYK